MLERIKWWSLWLIFSEPRKDAEYKYKQLHLTFSGDCWGCSSPRVAFVILNVYFSSNKWKISSSFNKTSAHNVVASTFRSYFTKNIHLTITSHCRKGQWKDVDFWRAPSVFVSLWQPLHTLQSMLIGRKYPKTTCKNLFKIFRP